MGDEVQKLKAEIDELKCQLEEVRAMLGIGQDPKGWLPDIQCKSLKVVDNDSTTVHLCSYRHAGSVTVVNPEGARVILQGHNTRRAIRIMPSGSDDTVVSIGELSGKGEIHVGRKDSKAFAEIRIGSKTALVDTYDDAGELSGRIPPPQTRDDS